MSKIAEGEWYKDRNIYIEIVKVLNKDWCEIHAMILRPYPGYELSDRRFLHEWNKQQNTPDGQWPGIVEGVTLLPNGPPQEILDALEWPSDGRGYRSPPRKQEY